MTTLASPSADGKVKLSTERLSDLPQATKLRSGGALNMSLGSPVPK
jgi:hypothetical protein